MSALGTPLTFDALLTRGATYVLGGAVVWALAVVLAVALEARTAGRLRPARWLGCPAPVRRGLLAVVVVLLAGHAGPAAAGEHRDPGGVVLDGLALPDRVEGAPALRRATRERSRTVIVRPGDSLWQIAAAELGEVCEDPSPAAIAAQVGRLHRANRATIGADPDLIRPGQHLLVPTPARHHCWRTR